MSFGYHITMDTLTPFLFVMTCLMFAHAQTYDPTLRLISCTRSNLVVKVTGVQEGGLIFIKGQGEDCKQATSSAEQFYEFDFASCNIKWEKTFRVVIQRLSAFQTGADKQIPVMCIANTDDIVVSNFIGAGDKDDDTGQNRTTKPKAALAFYKVITGEEVMGSEVKLTDRLILTLQLEEQYTNDLDMKARYCQAADIVIIDDFCAVEPELFGNFWKIKQGTLISEFGAFRTTNFDGGSVMMNFTCILQLCHGPCVPSKCGDSYTGWGRKRRDAQLGGGLEQTTYNEETIDVGGAVNVVEKYSDIKVLTNEDFCWDKLGISLLITFLCACAIGPSVGCFLLYRKLLICQKMLRDVTKFSRPASQKMSAAAILK